MKSLLVRWILCLLACAAILPGLSAEEEEIPKSVDKTRYERRRDHDPNGIGRFYLGREIAYVMGHQGLYWLERPEREAEEQLSKLIEALDLKPGMVVADVGAGSGVITMMISQKVGPTGKVLATDIQQEMLDAIAAKCKLAKVDNVELVRSSRTESKIKPGVVDLAIMVDVYHEFEFPYEMLKDLSATLKPGGRIAFVEYRKEDPNVPIKLVHKMTEDQVKKEALLPELGLKFVKNDDRLPRQHLILFEKLSPKE
jgi:SAM-dependent methyltransferase